MLLAQSNNLISMTFGFCDNLNNSAVGYTIGTDFQHSINQKHTIGIMISHTFTQSRGLLPQNIQSDNVFLRDFTNLNPFPFGNQYTIDNFPKKRLNAKPNKFFNLNIGIVYAYTIYHTKKRNLQIGIGGIISYFDKMELVDLIKADFTNDFLKVELKNYNFPVFQFDTFLDIGIMPFITYNYEINNKFSIGCTAKFFGFPKSESGFWTLSPLISYKF